MRFSKPDRFGTKSIDLFSKGRSDPAFFYKGFRAIFLTMSVPDSSKKTLQNPEIEPLPRENPFKSMLQMMRASTGRLPGHLVVIFALSLAVTMLCGIAFKLAAPAPGTESSLALRIKPEEGRQVLSETALRGAWVAQGRDSVLTLRLGNGIFEIIYKDLGSDTTRYFIRGSYRMEGNVLILQQRKEMGSPFDPANLQIEYYPLELGSLNLYADLSRTGMAWRIPDREMRRLTSSDIVTRDAFATTLNWLKISVTP